jgi:hypothetical protein
MASSQDRISTGVAMRPKRFVVLLAALTLGAAICVLPVQVASAQAPSTIVLIPSNNAIVSGTSQVLDATASSGVTQVQYEITGGTLTDSVIATATPTIYGWLAQWNITTVANGTYTFNSVVSSSGVTGTSPGITITVDNPTPSTTVVFPASGADVDQEQTSDYDAVASQGVTAFRSRSRSRERKTLCPPRHHVRLDRCRSQ